MTSPSAPNPLFTNIRWGLWCGLWYAVIYSAFVIGMAILRGSTEYPEHGLNTWIIIATYFALGLIGGVTIVLLRPLLQWGLGAAFVGFVIGTLIFIGIGVAQDGWSREALTDGVMLGAISGPLTAFLIRRQAKQFE